MVAKIITGKSVKGILNYNEHKVRAGQAELILAHRFLREPQELSFMEKLNRFERLMEKNPRVRTNAIHISLNFASGEKLDSRKLQEIAAAYMAQIGFEGQPFLVYRHLDAAHPHVHVVTTNIRPDGKRIDLHNIGRHKSEVARQAIEQEFGLERAEGRKQAAALPLTPVPAPAQYGTSETKQAISQIVTAVTRHYNYTSLAELNAALGCFNVTASRGSENSPMYRNKGLVYSIINQQGQQVGVPIKASALPGNPTLPKLEMRFKENARVRGLYKDALKHEIDTLLRTSSPLSRQAFIQRLHREQIQVLFRESKEGMTYGVTFINHARKAVLNGSELGKAYSAKALVARLDGGKGAPDQLHDMAPQATREFQAGAPQQETPSAPAFYHAAAPFIDALVHVEQQPDYLPHTLQHKKRKQKKRRPSL